MHDTTPSGTAIVGATMIDSRGVVEHSVVIINGGKIQASGTMAATPIPPGMEKVEGRGKFVVPLPEKLASLEKDQRASLLLLSADPRSDPANLRKVERVMVDGKWQAGTEPYAN
ncbi:MAG: hypothetical protein HYZ37_12450 [Candidatus Solibacter usitatus]|nr:hypothetical protein [Candidatus Solibacter usitatus]